MCFNKEKVDQSARCEEMEICIRKWFRFFNPSPIAVHLLHGHEEVIHAAYVVASPFRSAWLIASHRELLGSPPAAPRLSELTSPPDHRTHQYLPQLKRQVFLQPCLLKKVMKYTIPSFSHKERSYRAESWTRLRCFYTPCTAAFVPPSFHLALSCSQNALLLCIYHIHV